MTVLFRRSLLFLWLACLAPHLAAASLLDGWVATGHGGISVVLTPAGDTLRLDYVRKAPGFILLKRSQTFDIPDRYAIRFDVKAVADRSDLELRLPDPLANNVWSWKQFGFRWPSTWQEVTIPGRAIEFAWGPSPAPLKQAGAVELFITPTGGDHGSIELKQPVLEPLPPLTGRPHPLIRSRDSAPGFSPASLLAVKSHTVWRSRTGIGHPALTLDFGGLQAIGGLVADWCPDNAISGYRLEASTNEQDWRLLRAVSNPASGKTLLNLPDTETRFLRLTMDTRQASSASCLKALQLMPASQSAPNDFFSAVAKSAPRGDYPPYLLGQQSFYTVVGAPDSEQEGLLNQQGMLETGRGQFSIEPFLLTHHRLITWQDVRPVQTLEQGFLPIPTVRWQHRNLELSTSAFTVPVPGHAETLYARYRLHNSGNMPQQAQLLLALRPLQVNPPWQSLNMNGGFSGMYSIRRMDDSVIEVNGDQIVKSLTSPSDFGTIRLDQGNLLDSLHTGLLPQVREARDAAGFTAGVLAYDLDLAPKSTREVYIAIPPRSGAGNAAPRPVPASDNETGQDLFTQAVSGWSSLLQGPVFSGPAPMSDLFNALRSNLAYILIHRDGAAFQPGSRAYARSWIRDSALMSSALLGWGRSGEVREFIRWYAGFQGPDGSIPCCLDPRGAEVVPEHDSHGEFIHILAEYYRYTRDIELVRELWPAMARTVNAIDHLRQQRMTDVYRTGSQSAFFGLMPESISHEGYSGHPVHAFWDDFWALRGLKDAVMLAEALGHVDEAHRFSRLRDGVQESLKAAIARTIADKKLAYIPSSVELGDFDVNSTAMAINLGLDHDLLPPAPLRKTFDDYRDHFEKRRRGTIPWEAYTPYEVRSVEALIRLGRRQQALDLLDFLMAGRRPQGWNQWPEIVWRDASAPRFIGDSPHAWIGAEFIQAVRSLHAYERESDQSLVIAAGIPESWLKPGQRIGVENLPTGYGRLNYSMQREDDRTIRLTFGEGLNPPAGGIIVKAPSHRPLRHIVVNGRTLAVRSGEDAVVHEVPANVLLHY